MSWRDNQGWLQSNYRKARFRNAEFWVNDYSQDAGRRLSIQKFPGERYTNVQDLGADSTMYRINALLVGENYDAERNALEAALLQGGEGDLVLPWRNETMRVVVVGRIRTEESKSSRGACVVSFECIESAPPPAVFTPNTAARVAESAGAARAATLARFRNRFDNIGLSDARRAKMRAGLDSVSGYLVGIQGTVSASIGKIGARANQVNRLAGDLNSFANTPLELSDAIVNAVVTTWEALRAPARTLELVVVTWGRGGPVRILADTVFNFSNDYYGEKPTVSVLNAPGVREQRNLDELYRLAPLLALYRAAELLLRLLFENYQQAVDFRSDFIAATDPFLLDASDNEYEALSRVNEALGAYIDEIAPALPRLSTHTPLDTLPALVVSHQVYGDASRAEEIVQRNQIQHPGFVPHGEPLEVVDA